MSTGGSETDHEFEISSIWKAEVSSYMPDPIFLETQEWSRWEPYGCRMIKKKKHKKNPNSFPMAVIPF